MDANINNVNNELITKLPSASYTATDVLSKLITVDGAGSGLDADMLDGLNTNTLLPPTVDKSSVVSRDASGNFSANIITATVTTANNLNGNASNGFISRVAVGNHTARTITGTGGDIIVANGDGVGGNPTISAGANLPKKDSANTYTLPQSFALITANALSNDVNNNLFTGVNNLSTTSTNGFVYVPIIVGIPTGTPTNNTGRSPVVWDVSGNKLWIHSSGVWNSVSGDIVDGSITTSKLADGGVSNAKIANTYINDLPTVTFDPSTDFVAIADTSDAGNKKKALIAIPTVDGALRSIRVFTVSGTYTKPVGLVRAKITVVGGGGVGGQVGNSSGGGGGGGGTSIRLINTSLIGIDVVVTVGGSGGASSMGTLLSATGGVGSVGASGAGGGIGSGGDINIRGGAGGGGGSSNSGGSSSMGGGGGGGSGAGGAGGSGGNFGGGGGGAFVGASGGVGGGGIVIIEEFF